MRLRQRNLRCVSNLPRKEHACVKVDFDNGGQVVSLRIVDLQANDIVRAVPRQSNNSRGKYFRSIQRFIARSEIAQCPASHVLAAVLLCNRWIRPKNWCQGNNKGERQYANHACSFRWGHKLLGAFARLGSSLCRLVQAAGSALGHSRRFWRARRCPLGGDFRTCAADSVRSEKCHKQT